MTSNHHFKRRVRERAARTGESYTAALRHLRTPAGTESAVEHSVRLAVAQSTGRFDPGDVAGLHAAGEEARMLMRKAAKSGARVIHFAEGSLCSPNKRIMSSLGLGDVGPSDWSRCRWDILRDEIALMSSLAQELKIWAVVGSPHRLTSQRRPHNSVYVISDTGDLVTRYDERMLSNTKLSYMYTPGSLPVTFEVDGVRFGCALGMEAHYPELFIEYEHQGVDCMLLSTTGGAAFGAEISGHAASNSFWTSFAVHAQDSADAPAGIVAPDGSWVARCEANAAPGISLAVVSTDPSNPARPWRRIARSGLYKDHLANDDLRSAERASL